MREAPQLGFGRLPVTRQIERTALVPDAGRGDFLGAFLALQTLALRALQFVEELAHAFFLAAAAFASSAALTFGLGTAAAGAAGTGFGAATPFGAKSRLMRSPSLSE